MKVFIAGKGGVGKSTVSVGLSLALEGETALVSLDPAHNISDIVNEKKNMLNFEIIEPDFEREITTYLKKLTNKMKRESFRYLTVFNLDNLLDVLRYSPGTEEHMLLENIKKYMDYKKNVIFDTPPTGLFLKVLGLLDSSILWMQKLMELRQDILRRKGLKKDPILSTIEKRLEEYVNLKNTLKKEALFISITTEDILSLKETERIMGFLTKKGYRIPLVVVNRAKKEKTFFDGIQHVFIPEFSGETPIKIAQKIRLLIKGAVEEWHNF